MDRRDFLGFFGCGVGASMFPIQAFGKTQNNNKFIFILLRGALDGLAAFPSLGDPYLFKLRENLVTSEDYDLLDTGFFGIHKNLSFIKELYNQKQAILFHSISMNNVTRSHFEDQDYLEFLNKNADTGWLGRSMQYNNSSAISVGNSLSKILWGSERSSNWTSKRKEGAPDDYYETALLLSEEDYLIHSAISEAYDIKIISEFSSNMSLSDISNSSIGQTIRGLSNLLLYQNGNYDLEGSPDIGVLSIGGFDTHNRQQQRIRTPLATLNNAIQLLRQEFSDVWEQTTICVCTEFGRTVESNGAQGTDHGYGSVALLLGGNVDGGKTYTDWAGLNNLNENRDLLTTLYLEDLFASISHHILGVPTKSLKDVFPLKQNLQIYNVFT